jgi:hypothetical protein
MPLVGEDAFFATVSDAVRAFSATGQQA